MLNCQQFEDQLPELVDGGEWSAEQRAHGQSCLHCTNLVEDLRQIAQEAPELAAMHEPSPEVWLKLCKSLAAEGIIRPQAKTGRLMDFFFHPSWRPTLIPLGTAVALVILFVAYKSDSRPTNTALNQPVMITPASAAAMLDDDDVQLLDEVSRKTPGLRITYEDNLKSANAYIRDAKEAVAKSPESDGAREDLMHAYDEKTMVYEMAINRPSR
jgi:hypothetical protein